MPRPGGSARPLPETFDTHADEEPAMSYDDWRREVGDILRALRSPDCYGDTLGIYHHAGCTPRQTVLWLLREEAEEVPGKLGGKAK